jgi:flagellar hook-length control protein FliK
MAEPPAPRTAPRDEAPAAKSAVDANVPAETTQPNAAGQAPDKTVGKAKTPDAEIAAAQPTSSDAPVVITDPLLLALVMPAVVTAPAIPVATAKQPDAIATALQKTAEAASVRAGASFPMPLPGPETSAQLEPADMTASKPPAVTANAAPAEAPVATPAAALPMTGADANGIREAVARLATALAPGQPAPGSTKPGAAGTAAATTQAKTKVATSDGDANSSDLGQMPDAVGDKAAGQPATPIAAEQNGTAVRATRNGDADTKAADADQPAPKGADAPPPTPFGTALAGTAPGTLGATPQLGAAASPHGPAHVVENVPLSNVPVEIGMKSLAGVNHFEIRLAPDDLGRVDVKLHIDAEGRVKAHLVVERPETLAFLQRDAQQLQQTLEQAGLKTQENGVALSLRNSPSDQGFGQNRGGANEDSPQQSRRSSASGQADAADAITGPTRRLLWPRPSGVDLHI